MPKKLSSQSNKVGKQVNFKTPNLYLCNQLKKLSKYSLCYIQKSEFLICFMNWEKMRIPARPTFKNPNFQSLFELRKTWKYSLRPTFKSPNFGSMDELGKVMF